MTNKKLIDPYDPSVYKTERSAVAVIMHWMREIIKEKNINLGLPDVETAGTDRKLPDLVIYESRRSKKVLCVLEAKNPFFDIFNELELKEPARRKATQRKAKYFAVTNFKKLILFETSRVNEMALEENQIKQTYSLSDIDEIARIESAIYGTAIKKELEVFLTDLFEFNTGKKEYPKHPIDELLIFRLHEKIRVLSNFYRDIIYNKFHKDQEFAKKLQQWFFEQGWSFTYQSQDFDKAARQTAYLIINKLIFYKHLQVKKSDILAELEMPTHYRNGRSLQRFLQIYFDEALEIDYETIFTTDFIDFLAFPDSEEVIIEIESLVKALEHYDFSNLGFDVIGRIFERLIPSQERHNLGQYFTNADVVDLILKFCLKSDKDVVLDPSCGTGTFLVRAYKHKKLGNQFLKHEEILDTLWGVEIAKFPCHLATINMAIADLGIEKNYPNMIQEDFFELKSNMEDFVPVNWKKKRTQTLGKENIEIEYPGEFDAIVGNPPYTRQEEIPEIGVDKAKLIENAITNVNGNKIAEISKRAGIHAYFFVHGTKFLKNGGRFGFIVSNSWLDVDYGKGLQEFFLKNYKIVTIIESKVERWFEDADVNTCIVILEKCNEKNERNKNIVRFVYLKKPLKEFIPPVNTIWEEQRDRLFVLNDLKKSILIHNNIYEDSYFRIYPIEQKELFKKGWDNKIKNYIGDKWGKYLKCDITDNIIDKTKKQNFLIESKNVADVKPGCYSGINDFFYLEKKPKFITQIEEDFLTPIIRNTRIVKSIYIKSSEINNRVFYCNLSKKDLKKQNFKNAIDYINWGEKQYTRRRQKVDEGIPWPKVETVKNRKIGWWVIPEQNITKTNLFMNYVISKKFIAPYSDKPITSDRCFHRIFIFNKKDSKLLAALLNSTITNYSIEIYGRSNLGLGALKFEAMDAKKIKIIDPKSISKQKRKKILNVFNKLSKREILDIFNEIGAYSSEEVDFNKIKKDRRELDKIIMGEILGLSEEEQLDVYKAVVDLVKYRLERAKSVKNNMKIKNGININMFLEDVLEKIGEYNSGFFYKERILKLKKTREIDLPKLIASSKIDKGLFKWNLYYSGKKYIECETEEEARYFKIFLEIGFDSVVIPLDNDFLKSIIDDLENLKKRDEEIINSYLVSVTSVKTREMLRHRIWSEIFKSEEQE